MVAFSPRGSWLVVWILALVDGITAFNLYLTTEEVQTLLGLSREISYVRDGRVNYNAMKFPIPISENVEQLHFVWYNHLKSQISYSLHITTASNSEGALHQPYVNISHEGHIPEKPQIWRVTLPCTGRKTSQVEVTIEIDIKGLENNVITPLKFIRTKSCSAKEGSGVLQEHLDSVPPHHSFLIAMICACIVVAFIITIILIVHCRSRKIHQTAANSAANKTTITTTTATFRQQYEPVQQIDNDLMSGGNTMKGPSPPPVQYLDAGPGLPPVLTIDPRSHFGPSGGPGPGPNVVPEGLTSDAESRVTDWIQSHKDFGTLKKMDPEEVIQTLHVDRLRLKLGQLLQEGTFGKVYQGTFTSNDDGLEIDVVVKTVIAGSSATQSQLLIKEGTYLHGMNHRHIQNLVAATFDGTSPMLVYPYISQGNLKKWLLEYPAGLSTHQIVNLGLQLLTALQYIHRRKILHKDIATRNCFLNDGLVLKLGDSALSRDLFSPEYHCLGDNENRPIKWMPLETITYKKYSKASDVWSFGVFMWELMTRGQQPFADVDPFEMAGYIQEGYRLHQPMNCPDQLYTVMQTCWGLRPNERAAVPTLHAQLQDLQKQLQQFV